MAFADPQKTDTVTIDRTVSEEMITKTTQFARDIGQLSESVSYECVVATQFRELWKGEASHLSCARRRCK